MFHLHKGKHKHKHTEPASHVRAPFKPAGGDGLADAARGAHDQNAPAPRAGASHPSAKQHPTVHAVAAAPSDLTLDGDESAQTTGTAREGDQHTALAPDTPLPTTPLPADKGRTALTRDAVPAARTTGDKAVKRVAPTLDMGLFLDEEVKGPQLLGFGGIGVSVCVWMVGVSEAGPAP
jgi:hypothetical protein